MLRSRFRIRGVSYLLLLFLFASLGCATLGSTALVVITSIFSVLVSCIRDLVLFSFLLVFRRHCACNFCLICARLPGVSQPSERSSKEQLSANYPVPGGNQKYSVVHLLSIR